MSWRGWVVVALLLAALASGWSAWRQRAEPAAVVAANARPDYLLRDFELVSLDREGKEAFTLRAPELARDPNDETMALTTPVFLLPDRDGLHWTVESREGWVSADHSELRLRGAVEATSAPGGGRDMLMRTEELNVFPDTRQALSPVRVDITQPGSTMTGTGMRADLESRRIRFDSQVKTRYVPTRR